MIVHQHHHAATESIRFKYTNNETILYWAQHLDADNTNQTLNKLSLPAFYQVFELQLF